jgi:hypothetical protein
MIFLMNKSKQNEIKYINKTLNMDKAGFLV